SPPPQSADGPSPTTPPGYTPQISAEFSGIDPAALEGFEQSLARTEDTIGRNEPQIRRTLQKFDLETSRLTALRELQSWLATKRPDLRRRKETIESQQSEWATSTSSGHPALAAFDESLYEKAKHDPDVYAAIVNLTKATESGEVDPKTLTQLEKHAGNSPFALALLTTMGATAYRKTLGETIGNKQMAKLGTPLGKLLSTASPNLPPSWRNGLTADIWANRNEVRGLTKALRNGTFPHGFVMSAVKNLDLWARNRSTPDHEIVDDILTILANNPTRAQDYFINDPTALKYWVTTDHPEETQAQFAKLLELATTTFRDHSGTPQNPSRGYWSAKLASEFIHLEGQRIDKERFPVVPPATTALILSAYISDVNSTFEANDMFLSPGVSSADNPGTPGKDPWGAQFNRQNIRQIMKEAFSDGKAFAAVLASQTAFADLLLQHGAREIKEGRSSNYLMVNIKQVATGFGFITDAAGVAKIESAKELDEAQQRNMKILMAVVNSGLAIPQQGGWPVAAGVISAWTGLIEEASKGDTEKRARRDADSAAEHTRSLVQDLTARALLKNGVFGRPEPPSSTHPWSSLEGLEEGSDPRLNPNNFLKSNGMDLMSKDEMINKWATNTTERYQRLEAYRRWLFEGLSGKTWQAIEDRLDIGFDNGFNRYSS
ncbi:hypothetical protein C1I98_36765, partial [Spongiactinospora gelatinilytica]